MFFSFNKYSFNTSAASNTTRTDDSETKISRKKLENEMDLFTVLIKRITVCEQFRVLQVIGMHLISLVL